MADLRKDIDLSLMSSMTENLNFLQPNSFQVVMERKNFGTTTYMAQSFNHPSVSLGYAIQNYGKLDIAQPGDKFQIGELDINFLIDEDLKIYDELYTYMEYIRDNNIEYQPFVKDNLSHFMQISIHILSNKNNVNRSIKYKNCLISDLGSINFEAQDGDQYISFSASFKFTGFEVN